MATTTGVRLTKAGEALLTKIHQGKDKLRLTRFVIGDAVWTEQEIEDCDVVTLKHERVDANVSNISSGTGDQAGRVIADGLISNHTVNDWFYVREIGIMAEDPELGEILYAVDPVPKDAPTTVIETAAVRQDLPIRMELIAVTRDQVELTLTDSLDLVTKEYLWDVVEGIYSKLAEGATDVDASTLQGHPAEDFSLDGHQHTISDLTDFPETLPADGGHADTAKKLAEAVTIRISGGVTGTATSFDGSENITIPVTALNASNLNAGTVPAGRIPFATNAQAEAGTDTAVTLSPANLKAAMDQFGLFGNSKFTGNIDMNSLTINGLYLIGSESTNTPLANSTMFGIVINALNTSSFTQICIKLNSTTPTMWLRVCSAGTFSDWVQIYPALADLASATGTLPVSNGGTGSTAIEGASGFVSKLFPGFVSSLNAVPVISGSNYTGLGWMTPAALRNGLGLGNTTGAVPVENGGTGQTTLTAGSILVGNGANAVTLTTPQAMRNNMGLGNTTGALPVANGGTGVTSISTVAALNVSTWNGYTMRSGAGLTGTANTITFTW